MKEKSIFFDAACYLSIISGIVGFLTLLLSVVFYEIAIEKVMLLTNIKAVEKVTPLYLAITASLFAVSLAGVMKLLKKQKIGLYLYLIAQTALVILPLIWINPQSLSQTNLIFTVLFSAIYLLNYNKLN